MIKQFQGIFSVSPADLGCTEVVKHSIDVGDQSPIKQQPRRVPFTLRKQMSDMVDEMLHHGIVQSSRSPWASPVVLVKKKDGSMRFCVDYRKLNAVTKKDVFPPPRIDDVLDQLAGMQYFSTLDLASGYWQVKMDDDSKEKTAFTTPCGLYEFLVMPFGLCNAPATFQRLMEQVLHGLIGKCCVVYLDDILVIGETFEKHMDNLKKVLERLQEADLHLKMKKCHFVQTSAEYLGYLVSSQGISVDPRKVEAILNFPVPVDLKSLKSFLGLASYYRRFVPQFSKVAHPLYVLTKKDTPFVWGIEHQAAVETLKSLLTESAVLAFPNFEENFTLETDASKMGLGAVLSQEQSSGLQRPIAFASRSLQPHEQNYGVTEMEALGVVWAVKHFRPYIYGLHCTVITDHQALKSLLNTPQPSGKLARWGMAIQELDLTIEYRPGRKNQKADALSRYPSLNSCEKEDQEPCVVVAATSADTDLSLRNQQKSDATLLPFILFLENGQLPEEEKVAKQILYSQSRYTMVDGSLYYVVPDGTLRVIPPTNRRKALWEQSHAGPCGGHLKGAKMFGELSRHYWWPKMRSDIVKWCRGCLVCATRNVGRPVKAPLVPIPVGGPFDRVGVDVVKLPKSGRGHQYAVVFMDYLTKWPEVYPVRDQSASTIAKLLVEGIICRHGVPNQLLSDRGANFLSNLLTEVYSLMGIQKLNTTAYHPQTDGLVERFNRTLIDMLAKTVKSNCKDWDQRLPYVLFAYRCSPQSSTGESPFFLLYGRDPQLPKEAVLTPDPDRSQLDLDDNKSDLTHRMSEAWELAKDSVMKAQKSQKTQYDQSVRDFNTRVGGRVFIYMPAEKQTRTYKFARPFYGPYRVVERQGNTILAIPIDKPNSSPIHVSISRVRPCPEEIDDNSVWFGKKKDTGTPTVHDPRTDDNSLDTSITNAPEIELSVSDLAIVNEEANVPSDSSQKKPESMPQESWKTRLRKRKNRNGGRSS